MTLIDEMLLFQEHLSRIFNINDTIKALILLSLSFFFLFEPFLLMFKYFKVMSSCLSD